MSENIKSENYQWFRDLSSKEQETLAGGQIKNMLNEGNFLLQQTKIETTANNTLISANGDISSQNTKYLSSQLTLASSINLNLAIPNFSSLLNLINEPIVNILNKILADK
ncbi:MULTISPECIES: hypothetical protein [Nostoc]|uniref:Uncharacterized protein n=1 Tax=Nostoc paludosum FACHB-159 TaxID=2692908 RepID=A0ABR8K5F0_9NOSO|nr:MULTISPECIES: hypothetical protein [Nostoc]MBD2678284.1 hypothetical protein [Nostoc sp. FACHB-857]MBD2733402.1 hypothetical protein [Nostoc paludosum FACHB-159]